MPSRLGALDFPRGEGVSSPNRVWTALGFSTHIGGGVYFLAPGPIAKVMGMNNGERYERGFKEESVRRA